MGPFSIFTLVEKKDKIIPILKSFKYCLFSFPVLIVLFYISFFFNWEYFFDLSFSPIIKRGIKLSYESIGRRSSFEHNMQLFYSFIITTGICIGIIFYEIKRYLWLKNIPTTVKYSLRNLGLLFTAFFILLWTIGFFSGFYLNQIYFDHHFEKESGSLIFMVSNYLPTFEEYISNLYFFIAFGIVNFSMVPLFSFLTFRLKKYFFGIFGYFAILVVVFYFIFLIKRWGIWNILEITSAISFSIFLYLFFYFLFYFYDKLITFILHRKIKNDIEGDVIKYILNK